MNESSFIQEMTPKPEQALEFLDVWFKGSGVTDESLVSIVRIHPTTPKTDSFVFTLGQIKEAISTSGLDRLIWDSSTIYDLYFSVATLNEVPARGKRGGLKNVKMVPGVWIDFDVKEGYFTSQSEIKDFLSSQMNPPSILVLTGTGGVHAYWKLDKPISREDASTLALRWWAYQSELADGRLIDKLCDPSRVMRLPGAIRWPKKIDQPVSVVTLDSTSDLTYSLDTLMTVTDAVWERHELRIKKTRDSVNQGRFQAQQFFTSESYENEWMRLWDLSHLEDNFNETYTWNSILEPLGWTCLGEDDDKRVMWSRPGDGVRKSATTDWPESPNIMSLFSTADETGLAHLHESSIILTKYRVWVQLFWNGDETAAVNSLIK